MVIKAPAGKRSRKGEVDPWLILIWAALIILGPITLLIFLAGIPLLYRQLLTVCPTVCEDGRLSAAAVAQLLDSGGTMPLYAASSTMLAVVLALISFIVAGILLSQRPGDRMAVFTALLLILLGGTYSNADEFVGQLKPWLLTFTEILNNIGFGLFPILLLTLPDGRFVPGWSRWLALFLFVFSTITANISVSDFVFFIFFPIWALSGPVAQVYRYKRVANPIQKQQIKWVVTGMTVALVGFFCIVILGEIFGVDQGASPLFELFILSILTILIAIIPISIGIGILRYRLWDIDLIIRKTVQYTLLTGVLGLIYFGSVLLLQSLFGKVTGDQSPLIIVLSTLLIAALFNPLRGRLQYVIDRRFFRKKFNAQQVLSQFAQVVRDETDIDLLVVDLVEVVQQTMQPERVSVWLKDRR